MTRKQVALTLLAGALMVSLAAPSQAQKLNPAPSGPQEDLSALASGPSFVSRGETFTVMPGVWALPGAAPARRAVGPEAAQALTQRGVAFSRVLGSKGRFVLFTEQQGAAAAQPQAAEAQPQAAEAQQHRVALRTLAPSSSERLHPVVWNARTRGMGIVLGNLLVTLRSMDQAEPIAAATGLHLAAHLDRLNLAIYRVEPGQDVMAAQQALAAQPAVAKVEIEILERVRVPK